MQVPANKPLAITGPESQRKVRRGDIKKRGGGRGGRYGGIAGYYSLGTAGVVVFGQYTATIDALASTLRYQLAITASPLRLSAKKHTTRLLHLSCTILQLEQLCNEAQANIPFVRQNGAVKRVII